MGMSSFNRAREKATETAKETETAIEKQNLTKDDEKFNKLIVSLDKLGDKNISFIANHLGFEFKNKEETTLEIKEFLGLN